MKTQAMRIRDIHQIHMKAFVCRHDFECGIWAGFTFELDGCIMLLLFAQLAFIWQCVIDKKR